MRIGFFVCLHLKDIFFFSRNGLYRLHLKNLCSSYLRHWGSFLHAAITELIPQTGYRILYSMKNESMATRVHYGRCLEECARHLALTYFKILRAELVIDLMLNPWDRPALKTNIHVWPKKYLTLRLWKQRLVYGCAVSKKKK